MDITHTTTSVACALPLPLTKQNNFTKKTKYRAFIFIGKNGGAFCVETAPQPRLYHTDDSGFHSHRQQCSTRYNNRRLALPLATLLSPL